MGVSVRDTAFDTAKAIAIIGVCVGHSYPPQSLGQFINLFHMPLFFIVSGYFFSLKSLDNPREYVVKRVKRLYVPAVLMTWFVAITTIVWQKINYGDFNHSIIDVFWRAPLMISPNYYWFLTCLLIVSIMALVIFLTIRKFGKSQKLLLPISFVFVYFVGYLCLYRQINITDTLLRALLVAPLFFIGFLWKTYSEKVKVSAIIAMICFAVLLAVALMGDRCLIDIAGVIVPNPVSFLFFSIAGTYMVYCFSKFINQNDIVEKVFTYIGQNSLVIYLFNHLCNEAFEKITGGGVHWTLCSLFAIIVPLIIVAIYDKICNFASKYKKQLL